MGSARLSRTIQILPRRTSDPNILGPIRLGVQVKPFPKISAPSSPIGRGTGFALHEIAIASSSSDLASQPAPAWTLLLPTNFLPSQPSIASPVPHPCSFASRLRPVCLLTYSRLFSLAHASPARGPDHSAHSPGSSRPALPPSGLAFPSYRPGSMYPAWLLCVLLHTAPPSARASSRPADADGLAAAPLLACFCAPLLPRPGSVPGLPMRMDQRLLPSLWPCHYSSHEACDSDLFDQPSSCGCGAAPAARPTSRPIVNG